MVYIKGIKVRTLGGYHKCPTHMPHPLVYLRTGKEAREEEKGSQALALTCRMVGSALAALTQELF